MQITADEINSDLVKKIEEISGTNLMKCYQCGKCSAGCPMTESMDLLPHQVIRMVQLGKIEDIEPVSTAWVCAACLTCTVRCPRGIKIAEVMEAIRQVVLRRRDNQTGLGLSAEELAELPPIALISAYRKVAN